MPEPSLDLLALKNQADAALEGAADHMRDLLQEAVRRLDPFPPFPGAFFTYGIEVDAPGAESQPQRGCIVLAPDGELYELVLGQDLPALAEEIADPVAMRKEELKKLDNLHPRDYILYAYNALVKVIEILLEKQERRGQP
ncbi:MAG: hypothetical protein ACE5IZ_06405 [Dehalococcoidia bacterium]